ncbi:S41 family peptidase [bacterium]|uniref:PDZ domain-containing protein n=2 Tax=Katanobacteria TaxID=422282 RepID=A0A2M7X304_UNCKA|nr:S41 family peptidase [bacterium]PIP56934.1 MAG: hypothetical protein COX05_00360 [candidate division WWE3 bacterium CG22_combo_CG10-13_8_21_14_all_39_12]PJA40499.1 MAG: hypothetical protein CO179_02065 [candidate division WWE3 bacterium CG_4_9_14_3_um_filter_39_7]
MYQTTSNNIKKKINTSTIHAKRKLFSIVLLVAVGAFALGYIAKEPSGVLGNGVSTIFTPINNVGSKNENLDMKPFWDVLDLLESRYLDANNISGQDIVDGAIRGMVQAAGDPYTSYYSPEENISFKDSLEGLYEGIGAQLGYKDDQLVIISPLDESPAQKAGVKAADYIIGVDGESTAGWTIEKAVQRIRGEAGSSVTLSLVRLGNSFDPFDVEIERSTIQLPAVRLSWVKDEEGNETNVAHIRVLRFGSDTVSTWDEVVRDAKFSGAKSIILDVRNNPGGLLSAAIYLGSDFFSDGVVVKRESRTDVEEFTVDHTCKLCDIPVVVLINEGSASASEILAGALQARGRAELVGVGSFGKGTVQEAVELEGGAGVHITVARWLLPNDQNIHGEGLTPDYVVETEDQTGPYSDSENVNDLQLLKAYELLK